MTIETGDSAAWQVQSPQTDTSLISVLWFLIF